MPLTDYLRGCSAETETTFQIQMAENPKSLADAGPVEGNYLDEWVDMFVEDTYTNTGHAVQHALQLVQTFGRPRISSTNKRVCRPSLSGTARNGGTSTATPQDLTVKYHCLDKGEAIIQVTIPVGIFLDVSFSFTKRCKRDAVKGFIMLPKGSSERVVTNGVASPKYKAVVEQGYVSTQGMVVYGRANKTATFTSTISRNSGGITYLPPLIRSSPAICEPHFDGDMAKGGILSAAKPLSMIVRFNCDQQGMAVITVRIPFADDTLDDVVFSIIKDNGSQAPSKGAIFCCFSVDCRRFCD